MKSKLGFHVLQAGGDLLNVVAATKPAVLVTMDTGAIWREIRAASPDTLIIVRPPFDDGEMPYQNPVTNSQWLFERLRPTIEATRDWADGFAGPNEPDVQTIDDAKRLSAYYVNFARLMHSAGTKVGFGSFSNGTPKKGDRLADGTVEVNLLPHLEDGNAACDWTFLHEYGGRRLQDQFGFLFGRHRAFWEGMPPLKRRDIVLIELGLSGESIGRPQEGWGLILNGDEADYLDTLVYADLRLQETPFVIGGAIFCWYGFGIKDSYAIKDAKKVHAWIARGGDLAPPPNPPVPLKHPLEFPMQVLRLFEGFTPTAKSDKGGRMVIGIGHGFAPGDPQWSNRTLTLDDALGLLRQDAMRFAQLIESSVSVELNDFQFAACLDLAFRVGPGKEDPKKPTGWLGSELRAKLNRGDYRGAAEEFLRWNKVRDAQNKLVVHPASDERARIERVIFLLGTPL